MTKIQNRRIIIAILAVVLLIITLERIYNSRDVFQVTAEDASYYGIVEANLTTKEKLEDFEYLYDTLEKHYTFFKVNERLYGIDWLGNKSKYERMIKNTKNDAEFFVALEKIMGDLNNGHTSVFNGNSYEWFYKAYYDSYVQYGAVEYEPWFKVLDNAGVKERYQFDGSAERIELFGDSVLETKVLIEDELAYMKIEGMAGYDVLQKDYPKAKKFLKEVEDYEKLIIDIRGNTGGSDYYWQSMIKLLIDETLKNRYYSFFKEGQENPAYRYKIQHLKPISNLNKDILNQFPEEVRTDFDYYKTYFLQISPGGVFSNPSEYIDFKGKVYLLVDRNVFSASEEFAAFAKDTGFATLVGEPTGGDRVFEEIPVDFLPNSKLVFRYSRELAMNADGTINMETKTIPHIIVDDPTPQEDFTKDQCIRAVIND